MRTVPDKPALSVDGVTFRYGTTPVLIDLTLSIGAGDRVALLGPNGSGKSTLFDLFTGTSKPESGSVTARGAIALVPQRSAVSDRLPITVRETVQMGRWQERGAWRRLTSEDQSIVDEQIERLGLQDLTSRRLGQLSGGQRQRTLLAMALAQQAPILLLDEPEAGLDADARATIAEVIADEVGSGTTVVVATHEIATATASHRCVLLGAHAAGVIADGPPEEVLTDSMLASAFTRRGDAHI